MPERQRLTLAGARMRRTERVGFRPRLEIRPPAEVMTDDLIAALYGVVAEVGRVPPGPFLLPQTARLPA